VIVTASIAFGAGSAQAAYAPINHSGPPLEVARAKLRAALR
jgi:hypothetical protein